MDRVRNIESVPYRTDRRVSLTSAHTTKYKQIDSEVTVLQAPVISERMDDRLLIPLLSDVKS